jgi:hypothetical protein
MWDQPKVTSLQESPFFANNSSARLPVEGTVARGQLKTDKALHEGLANGQAATSFPYEITRKILDAGNERFDIFCSPCHSKIGDGNGMIVQRGFQRPASLHEERLRSASVGYIFRAAFIGVDVANGNVADAAKTEDKVHGPIGRQLSVDEQWSIVAYIRALQLSQNVPASRIPAEDRANLKSTTQGGNDAGH